MSLSAPTPQLRLKRAELISLASLSAQELESWIQEVHPHYRLTILDQLGHFESQGPILRSLATDPLPRQATFEGLGCEEALFGGAAGGAKSFALIRAAVKHCFLPGYRAILFRRSYPQLAAADGLIPKAEEMLDGIAKWHGTAHKFTFASGAELRFSHLQDHRALQDHQGAAYHFCGFDELTQFPQKFYTYLFSRQRKKKDDSELSKVPTMMRATSNPGGVGHTWVKNRFITPEAAADLKAGNLKQVYWVNPKRCFVPSRLEDNIYLDQEEYSEKFEHLDPVEREQLRNGDWSIRADGRIKSHWLRYYDVQGEQYRLLNKQQEQICQIPWSACTRFVIVDCAGTSQDVAKESKGKAHSFSVIATFDWEPRTSNLIWRSLKRGRWEVPELIANIRQVCGEQLPAQLGVEYANMGIAVCQQLEREQRFMRIMRRLETGGKDKVTRAVPVLNMLEKGQIWLPRFAPWRDALEGELLGWTGHPDEQDDQVDVLAYGGQLAGIYSSRVIVWLGA